MGPMSYDTSLQSELWHQIFSQLHYKALLGVRNMVIGMPNFNMNHEGIC